jgi:hypothetical protein
MILEIPIGSVEKNTGMALIPSVEFHKRNPNPVYPPQFPL